MFQINQTLLTNYDNATSIDDKVRISCAFFRNKTTKELDAELTTAMEDAFEMATARTNDEATKAIQEDVLDYMEKLGTKCSAQVLRADTFRMKKMLSGPVVRPAGKAQQLEGRQ